MINSHLKFLITAMAKSHTLSIYVDLRDMATFKSSYYIFSLFFSSQYLQR